MVSNLSASSRDRLIINVIIQLNSYAHVNIVLVYSEYENSDGIMIELTVLIKEERTDGGLFLPV